jgi:hypothetical protein
MEFPTHPNPLTDLVMKAMIALPDLERMAETGRAPDDMAFMRALAASARRWMDEMDG